MNLLRPILALVKKELLAVLKDKRSRFVLFVPPVVQLLVFGYAATFDLLDVPLAVYDEDGGEAARALTADMEGSPVFRLVKRIKSNDEVAPLVGSKDVLVVLHIPRDFERDLNAGESAGVQFILDGRNSNTALIALGYASRIVEDFNREWSRRLGRRNAPARLVTRAWFNENLQSRWFIVPGIVGLLTLVVTMLITALSVAREREQGTFDQLLVTPMVPLQILLGKTLPGFLVGILEGTLIVLVAVFFFGVPLRGSLPGLYAAMLVFLLCATGVGLMISSISVTQQQGLLGAFLFLVPAIILSGFATPIENMPPWMQKLTLLNPMRHFEEILRRIFLEAAPLSDLVHALWPMAVIGLLTLAAAAWLFRRRIS